MLSAFDRSGMRALLQQASLDSSLTFSPEVLTRHVRALWHHVGQLERGAGSAATAGVSGEEIMIQVGAASILLKKDGTIHIKGKDITIEGSGQINIKSSKDIVMRGSKIRQN